MARMEQFEIKYYEEAGLIYLVQENQYQDDSVITIHPLQAGLFIRLLEKAAELAFDEMEE